MWIVANALQMAADKGICVLVITHDKEFINIVADELLQLS